MQVQREFSQMLCRRGLLSPDAAEQMLEQQREKQLPLCDLIVQSKVASELDVARILAAECQLPVQETVSIDEIDIVVATRIGIGFAKAHRLLVVAETEESVSVVCGDPLDVEGLDAVRTVYGKCVELRVVPIGILTDAINRVYERQQTSDELHTEDEKSETEEVDIL